MGYVKPAFKWILHGVQQSEAVIGFATLLLTTFLIFASVANRYALHFPALGLNDLALYSFIIFMFAAGAFATWRESHISVDYFYQRALKGKPRAIAIHSVCIVVISIVLASVFLDRAHNVLLRALKYSEYGSLVRWFNESWLVVVFFVAICLILLHLLVILRRDIGELVAICRSPAGGEKP